jgi:hypothetical protein
MGAIMEPKRSHSHQCNKLMIWWQRPLSAECWWKSDWPESLHPFPFFSPIKADTSHQMDNFYYIASPSLHHSDVIMVYNHKEKICWRAFTQRLWWRSILHVSSNSSLSDICFLDCEIYKPIMSTRQPSSPIVAQYLHIWTRSKSVEMFYTNFPYCSCQDLSDLCFEGGQLFYCSLSCPRNGPMVVASPSGRLAQRRASSKTLRSIWRAFPAAQVMSPGLYPFIPATNWITSRSRYIKQIAFCYTQF